MPPSPIPVLSYGGFSTGLLTRSHFPTSRYVRYVEESRTTTPDRDTLPSTTSTTSIVEEEEYDVVDDEEFLAASVESLDRSLDGNIIQQRIDAMESSLNGMSMN